MIKRKQITNDDEAILTFEIVQHIPVRLVSVEILKALKLALEFNIYAYDAYFLECARSLACPFLH